MQECSLGSLFAGLFVGLLGACSPRPTQYSQYARAHGMRRDVVVGTVFEHVVFTRIKPARVLHVYLDGDGTPWQPWGPASDPTPRNPLVLRLMASDPAPSLYLGRPCYLGLSETPSCSGDSGRPTDTPKTSCRAWKRRCAGSLPAQTTTASCGSATVAAARWPPCWRRDSIGTTDLVTIAANLDIDAWTDLHGYSRLTGSLNPARRPPLPAWIRQRHYVGGKDRVVPPNVVPYDTIDSGTVTVIPSYDHTCCWEAIWPTLLADVERGSAAGH